MGNLMNASEAAMAIHDSQPLVIESRKYGIVADYYTAKDKGSFFIWLRRQRHVGEYPMRDYGETWRAWRTTPTEEERGAAPWTSAKH